MLIYKYFLKKLIFTLIISIFIFLLVFFVFSIIGNLEKNYNFINIVVLSLLDSIQIILFVPSILFLFVLFLTFYLLNSKNELLVYRHYVSKIKLIFLLIFFIFLMVNLDINKSFTSNYVTEIKNLIEKKKNNENFKLIINENKNSKQYLVIEGLEDLKSINLYELINDKITNSIYTENFKYDQNNLSIHNFYEQKNDQIYLNSGFKNFEITNIGKIFRNNLFINKINKSFLSFEIIQKYTHYLILYTLIILIIFNQSSNSKKKIQLKPFFFSLLLIIYSFMLYNININSFDLIFHILGTSLLLIILFKKLIYE